MAYSHFRKIRKDQHGLTLVEILATIVILAIVSAIAVILIGQIIENAKKDAVVANALQVLEATKIAEASGDLSFSSSIDKIVVYDSSVNPKVNLLAFGTIISPWRKDEYDFIEVTKNPQTGIFSVQLHPVFTADLRKCWVNNKTEAQLLQGRKVACPM